MFSASNISLTSILVSRIFFDIFCLFLSLGMPHFANLAVFFNIVQNGRGGSNQCKKQTCRTRIGLYGNGIKSANIFYQIFKRKGGGGKGVLNNVKKNCKIGKAGPPLSVLCTSWVSSVSVASELFSSPGNSSSSILPLTHSQPASEDSFF